MAKVNASEFRQKVARILPEDFMDAAILTTSEFVSGTREDTGGKWAFLRFDETDDKVYWLTEANVETMVTRYGDDTDGWLGQPVPLEKYRVRPGGPEKVRMMAIEEWDTAFSEAGVKVPPRTRGT